MAKDPSKLRFGNRLALNGRLICGKCGRTLKRYVKAQEDLTDWRCRQRALVKKTDFHEDVPSRCDCRIVREVEAQRAVVMAFNELPRLLLELVDEMVMKSGTAPLWMNRDAENENEESGACRDYDDFFSCTRYTVPEGVLDENGGAERQLVFPEP